MTRSRLVLTVTAVALVAALAFPSGGVDVARAGPGSHAGNLNTATITFLKGGDPTKCATAPQAKCAKFKITCPNLASLEGYHARSPATKKKVGVLAIFSGGAGTRYWSDTPNSKEKTRIVDLINAARAGGLDVYQVRWASDWLAADAGQDDGLHVACRPGRWMKWVHDNRWSGNPATVGACGFCIVGTSGGSSAVSWIMTHYGGGSMVDAAFPVGGPPHGNMAKGCIPKPGQEAYAYPERGSSIQQIDAPFKANGGDHCRNHNEKYRQKWNQNSIVTTQSKGTHHHPSSRVHIIDGSKDPLRAHGWDFALRMMDPANPSPYAAFEIVPGMPHGVSQSVAGMERLRLAILQTDAAAMKACNNGIDDDQDGAVDFSGGDGGCTSEADASEKEVGVACDNGRDDDLDGFVDYRTELADPHCANATDVSETA